MLTDPKCRNAKCPDDRQRVRLADAGGLYLEVAANGSKRWFAKYRFGGKERRIAFGAYPGVSLKAAREGRDEARKTRAEGADPVQARRVVKLSRSASAGVTFEAIAREFHALKAPEWSGVHAAQWLRCCEKDLFPYLGALPLSDVTAPVLLAALQRVEARGAKVMARDLCQYAGQVFRHGMRAGLCGTDPAAVVRGGLSAPIERHMGAVVEPVKAGALMRAIDCYNGHPATRAALLLSALLFQRPGNIRAMEWAEIGTDAALWTIPAAKMKRRMYGKANGRPHFVPLPSQALAVLEELRPLTGHGRFVFPSLLTGEKCMSENTVRAALRGMGYSNDEMTAHGFRAMARTLVAENMPSVSPEVIEAQLAHGKSGPLGMAYDRAEFMAQRRALMKAWADYLDKLREGGEVIPLRAA